MLVSGGNGMMSGFRGKSEAAWARPRRTSKGASIGTTILHKLSPSLVRGRALRSQNNLLGKAGNFSRHRQRSGQGSVKVLSPPLRSGY